MERGSGNRVKKSYGRRSPLKIPILPLIIQGVSMAASAINKSNKKAAAKNQANMGKKSEFAKTGGGAKTTAGIGAGGGSKVAAAAPGALGGGLKAGGGAEKVKPMKATKA